MTEVVTPAAELAHGPSSHNVRNLIVTNMAPIIIAITVNTTGLNSRTMTMVELSCGSANDIVIVESLFSILNNGGGGSTS
jgi:hypothetical protein